MRKNVKIHIDGVDTSRVTTTKFLDVIINETLTWDDHIIIIIIIIIIITSNLFTRSKSQPYRRIRGAV